MRKRLLPVTLLVAALLLVPVRAAAADADYTALFPVLRAHEARLLTLGWRLARANADFCLERRGAIGLMLTDIRDFKRPRDAQAALRIAGNVAIAARAEGSPAAAAGLRAGEELRAVNGAAATSKAQAYDRIESALAASGAVTLAISPAGAPVGAGAGGAARSVTIRGEPACPARYELLMGSTVVKTDGVTVQTSVDVLAEHAADDEAATMVAHELAHNALGHVARLNAGTRNYVTVRRTEREADRLAIWLMANAGYDPAAGPRFIAAWGPRHSGGMTRSPTHDAWRDRVALMQEEVAIVAAARATGPTRPLDWRAVFPGQDGRPIR